MGIGELMLVETGIVMLILFAAVIAAGLIYLAHYLKRKDMAVGVEMMKDKLFPEMEAMTDRMMANVIDKTMKSTIEMTQKLQNSI